MKIDRKLSWIILIGIVTFYGIFAVPDVFVERDYDDALRVQHRLHNLTFENYDVYLRYILLQPGEYFGIPKLVPFIESIITLVLVFVVASNLAGRNISGLIAVIIVSTSNIFQFYDTSIAYDNSWNIFLLLSIHFRKRLWGPVSFMSSIFCKPLTLAFIPAMIIISLKEKRLGIPYLIIGFVGIVLIYQFYTGFNPVEFGYGLIEWTYWLQADPYIIIMIPVVIIALFIVSRMGYKNTYIPIWMMLNVIISGGIVEGFTGMWNQGYRYIPLVIFFAIGVGILLQKNPKIVRH